MRHLLRIASLGLVIVLFSASAKADPILYDTTFTGNRINGTGSFLFDNDVGLITDFVWDFGDGIVGGISDSSFLVNPVVFGDTKGRFIFEMLTEIDVHPVDCIDGCSTTLDYFGLDPLNITSECFVCNFSLNGGDEFGFGANASYVIRFFGTDISWGGITATLAQVPPPTSVPEPGTLTLFGLGLLGMGFARRKKV